MIVPSTVIPLIVLYHRLEKSVQFKTKDNALSILYLANDRITFKIVKLVKCFENCGCMLCKYNYTALGTRAKLKLLLVRKEVEDCFEKTLVDKVILCKFSVVSIVPQGFLDKSKAFTRSLSSYHLVLPVI